ncbi:CBS domain-containing protein [Aquincola sp. MAHUQ-54]|uniref:CBS domain-containing protein n=1 Tax=Aquincola agrisoli TaxID=3119538 RepID=A0AAW9Q199_9BURK
MQVTDILSSKQGALRTVHPETPLSACVIQMADEDLGSLLVVDDHARLVGLLTFREVIRTLAQRQKELRRGPTPPVAELRVSEVMERAPISATPDMELQPLRAMMIRHHQRYLPVLDGGRLVGVVSFHDIAKSVYEEQQFENRMLKAYIQDWPAET